MKEPIPLKSRTVEWYRMQLFQYGILSSLYAIQYFEKEEEFEQCGMILEAIEIQKVRLDTWFPTRLDDEAMNFVLREHKDKPRINKAWLEDTHKYYAEFVMKGGM